jgi:hypothetical protein
LVEQFLQHPTVGKTLTDFGDEIFGHIQGAPAPIYGYVKHMTAMLLT